MSRHARRVHRARRRAPALFSSAAIIGVIGAAVAVYFVADNRVVSPELAELTIERTVALDFMGGKAVAGWSDAAPGGAWELSPNSAFAIDDGVGTMTLDRSRSVAVARLGATMSIDTLAFVTAQLPTVTGSTSSLAVAVRSVGDAAYQAVISPSGAESVELRVERIDSADIAPTVLERVQFTRDAPAANLVIEFSAIGNDRVDLRARAWTPTAAQSAADIRTSDSSAARLTGPGGVRFTGDRGDEDSLAIRLDDVKVFDVSAQAAARAPAATVDVLSNSTTSEPEADAPGAARVGTTEYLVPAGAVVVAPRGSDSADGTWSRPLQSLEAAIDRSHPGSTIIVRQGVYHEAVVIEKDTHLTLQSAPGEEVWLDGTIRVDSFQQDGATWVARNWTTRFDSSPTYTKGLPDNTREGWRFVSAEHPMAAHPDQVWVGGKAQAQVGSRAELRPGAFFVDYDSSSLHLGSDPTGGEVRASILERAMRILSTDTVVRGLGVRGYSPSVPQLGAITSESAGATLENVEILDSATTGLFVREPGSVVRNVTVRRSGMLGISVSYADDILFDEVVSVENNTESFNRAPVSGGMKVTRSRGVTVTDSSFETNAGHGLWFDESVFDGVASRNRISDNAGHGLVMEISAQFVVAGNLITDNEKNGIKLNNTSGVQIWHNTLLGNNRAINIVQDGRRAADEATPGHDPRQAFPDPTMTWLVDLVTVSNNVLGRSTGNCLLCVEDYSKQFTAEEMGVTVSGNVFQRESAGSPAWLVVWSEGTAPDPSVYATLERFSAATGEESEGIEITGSQVINKAGRVLPSVAKVASAFTEPVPDGIRNILGSDTLARIGAVQR